MTNPLHDRRGPAVGRLATRLRPSRGGVVELAIAGALVLAPLPVLAGPSAAPPAEGATAPAEGQTSPDAPPSADDPVERAMAAYQRGTDNYNHAKYDEALADFREAASLYASPDFQYNIGLCYEKLEKYDEAIGAFTAYLRAKPNAEDRPNVEDRIEGLKVDRDRKQQEDEEARAAEKARAAEEARAAEAAARAAEPPPPVVDSGPPPGRTLILSGSALAGVGGALALGGGIALGVLARQRSLDVDRAQTEGNPDELSFAELEALEAEGKRFEGIQVGLVAGGAVVAVTGAVLLALGLRKRGAAASSKAGGAEARLVPTRGGLMLTGRF